MNDMLDVPELTWRGRRIFPAYSISGNAKNPESAKIANTYRTAPTSGEILNAAYGIGRDGEPVCPMFEFGKSAEEIKEGTCMFVRNAKELVVLPDEVFFEPGTGWVAKGGYPLPLGRLRHQRGGPFAAKDLFQGDEEMLGYLVDMAPRSTLIYNLSDPSGLSPVILIHSCYNSHGIISIDGGPGYYTRDRRTIERSEPLFTPRETVTVEMPEDEHRRYIEFLRTTRTAQEK